MGEGDTWINALIGAVVTFFVGMVIPFVGPVVGGGTAGYLQGPDTSEGLRVGAISGGIAAVPYLLLGAFMLFFVGALAIGEGAAAGGLGLLIVLALIAGLIAYSVGLSALGGYIGAHINDDQ